MNVQGKKTETPREATQAENSPDTLVILFVSMTVIIVIAGLALWYFGFLPGTTPISPRQN